jgi:hypothetical protein
MVSNRALRVLRIVYNVIDRIILPLGFVTLATGIVTYSDIFVRITAKVMDNSTNSISNRKDSKSSADSRISSGMAYSSGTVSLSWVDTWAAGQISDGPGT